MALAGPKSSPCREFKATKSAVQNPLTTLADDVAATQRALDLQDVGYSWGDVVVTEAGNHTSVVGLVYLAGFASGSGQSLADVSSQGPAAPGGQQFAADAMGFIRIRRQGMDEDSNPDVPAAERRVLFAAQHSFAAASASQVITTAAWKIKPSWYLVADDDRDGEPRAAAGHGQQNRRHHAIARCWPPAHAVTAGVRCCFYYGSGPAAGGLRIDARLVVTQYWAAGLVSLEAKAVAASKVRLSVVARRFCEPESFERLSMYFY